MKKAQKSVRWSPGRVGVRVINSRRAKKDIRPNKMTEPRPPVARATPKMATMTHHAFTRASRLATTALGVPPRMARAPKVPSVPAPENRMPMAKSTLVLEKLMAGGLVTLERQESREDDERLDRQAERRA